MRKVAYKVIITVVYYDDEAKENQTETILFWAKDEMEIGKTLKSRYGDSIVSYEVKWLNDDELILPEDTEIISKIIEKNSY